MQGLLWPGCQWYPEVKERCGLENTKGTGDACAYLPTRTAENFNFMSLISPDTKNAVSVNHNEFVVHFMFIDCRPGAKVQVSRCRVCMQGLRVSTRNWNAQGMYYKGWSSSSVWHYLLQAPTKGGWKLFMCKKPYFGQALGGLWVVGFSKETTGNIFSNSAAKTINWLLYCKGKFKTSAEGWKRGTRGLKKKMAKKGKAHGAGSAHFILDFSHCMAWYSPRMSQISASYNTSAEEPAAISKVHLDLLDYPKTNTTQRLPLERHQVSKPVFLTPTFQERLQLASFPTTK